jgi:lantibiotic modifying enzyme
MKQKKTIHEEMLTRIANHLIINASFLSDPGLIHGKMGIALFFVHYARYTGNTCYDDFAGELIDEVTEEIHKSMSVDFESGLSGIGWGINYLLKNGFMEGDPNTIFSDIDKKIMEINVSRMMDASVRTGLKGISYYIEKRIEQSAKKRNAFDGIFLEDYLSAKQKHNISVPNEAEILSAIYNETPKNEDITKWQLGLENGCAGYGLKSILI